ncbi:ejaculatory bulb-specific protein 3 [Diachasma alloeum]|uniref:Chemosensory protein 6 n=1 Tax=Diachasma alloeum TaxID=454923 RepID=A0A4E0RP50_9HYME|nr:ejaculatory bulb-specific protein 3 [Diachasma alloeum]THK33176.1 chemosensory protein 6 [Diachasma alloeum]
MRAVVILCLLIGSVIAQKAGKYDNVDVDAILKNNRVLTQYIKCMLGEGSCTAEGRELKKVLPDALKTNCAKCDEKQKSTAEKVINHLRSNRPNEWNRLVAKYDPQGEYEKRFEAAASAKN